MFTAKLLTNKNVSIFLDHKFDVLLILCQLVIYFTKINHTRYY